MSEDPPTGFGGEARLRPTSVEDAFRLLDLARAVAPGVGERIGPYELVEEIGRGTHSVVYRARQQIPIAREVAIKVLFDASEGGNVRLRFLRERALLAQVDHPGITHLLDCGETEATEVRSSLPWFAMPLVVGETIDRWCGRMQTTRVTRLFVLERLAEAVGAAHAAGIVHRDLKPSNVLVSGEVHDPRVTVIDFGIAKVLDSETLGAHSLQQTIAAVETRRGSVVGTPEFMSPEQADLDSARVGAASDVYAIGLIACVLLSGRVPGTVSADDAETSSMGSRLRAASAREVEPISRLASDRSLRGEIEWIVAKCCTRDPRFRYIDARALADDLRRFREGEPITAAPPESGYLVRFILRKHRVLIAAALLSIVFAVGSLVALAVYENARAERESAQRTRLSELLEQTRQSLTPLTGRTRGDLVADPEQAVVIASAMHAVNLELLGEDAVESQRSALTLARALDRADRHIESEKIFRLLLSQAEREPNRQGDVARINTQLVGSLRRQGPSRAVEAIILADVALSRHEALGNELPSAIELRVERGMVLDFLERHDEARASLELGLQMALTKVGPSHFLTRQARGFLADHDRLRGRVDDARANYLQSLEGWSVPSAPYTRPLHYEELLAIGWRGEVLAIDCLRGTASESDRAELGALCVALGHQFPADPRIQRWRTVIANADVRTVR